MVTVKRYNEVYSKIDCEPSIAMELSEKFSFYVNGYRYMPAYRNRIWNGKINLFNRQTRLIYSGLVEEIEKFCKERDYEFINETSVDHEYSLHEAVRDIKNMELSKDPRDYQLEAYTHAIRKSKALLLSPTASGKSLIIYMLIRYYGERTLVIVPTINLVKQAVKHFNSYGNGIDDIHAITAGITKQINIHTNIVITTWQSIYKQPKEWFDQFKAVMVDEVHHAKAKSLTGIMEKTVNTKYKFGFTGTLDDIQTHIMVITGLFGPVKKIVSSAQLMKEGHIAPLKIKAILLEYPEHVKRLAGTYKYSDEIDYIVGNKARNRFIKNLALSLKGNTLILFQFVDKHGKVLHDSLKNCGKNVYYASGETDGDLREEIRNIISKEDNCIFVASSGTFSTGADMPRINNVIFASPTKSKIKVLQSIGRGLRNSPGKEHCTLYDIADDLSWKKHQNYTLIHFLARMKIYAEERFVYKLYRVKIKA